MLKYTVEMQAPISLGITQINRVQIIIEFYKFIEASKVSCNNNVRPQLFCLTVATLIICATPSAMVLNNLQSPQSIWGIFFNIIAAVTIKTGSK